MDICVNKYMYIYIYCGYTPDLLHLPLPHRGLRLWDHHLQHQQARFRKAHTHTHAVSTIKNAPFRRRPYPCTVKVHYTCTQ